MRQLNLSRSPLTPILLHPGHSAGIRLYLKRDDLLHPTIQGNKWRKIQPALQQIQEKNLPGILTFGGPFSNHLHAVAAAGSAFDFKTVGIVRGTAVDFNNPTLLDARNNGMALHAVPKKDFDTKGPMTQDIIAQYANFLYLPEGGATPEAATHCKQLAVEIQQQLTETNTTVFQQPLFLAIPAGTGCTAAGLAAGWPSPDTTVLVFPAAGYGVDLAALQDLLPELKQPKPDIRFVQDYIQGGFAKMSPELRAFVDDFKNSTSILLDPIYTSKMMFGIFDLLKKQYFPENAVIVAVHTGGLQGWRGVYK